MCFATKISSIILQFELKSSPSLPLFRGDGKRIHSTLACNLAASHVRCRSDFPYIRLSALICIVMSPVERTLLVGWIIIVVLGVVFYLTHPKRSWIKKLQKKLAASGKHSKKMSS